MGRYFRSLGTAVETNLSAHMPSRFTAFNLVEEYVGRNSMT
jgi:hypothetical protein